MIKYVTTGKTTKANIHYIVTISDTRENCDQVFASKRFDDYEAAHHCYYEFCKELFSEGDTEHKAVTLWQEYSDGMTCSLYYMDEKEYENTIESLRYFFGDDFEI